MDSVRDRTSEFFQYAQDFQTGLTSREAYPAAQLNTYTAAKAATPRQQEHVIAQRPFNKLAASIGRGIDKTEAKVANLEQLTKQTSLFDDPAQEIGQSTALIKTDLIYLNQQICQLVEEGKSEQRTTRSQTDHSATVVASLRKRLKAVTVHFQSVLEDRKAKLQSFHARRTAYGAATTSQSSLAVQQLRRRGQPGNQQEASPLLQQRDYDGYSSHYEPPVPSFMQTQAALEQQQQPDPLLQQRREAMRLVETTISELGSMFQQLAGLVQEQGEMAVRIDEHMEDTLSNVAGAQTQLLKYYRVLSSSRWLMLKIFAILFLFLMFYIIFMA